MSTVVSPVTPLVTLPVTSPVSLSTESQSTTALQTRKDVQPGLLIHRDSAHAGEGEHGIHLGATLLRRRSPRRPLSVSSLLPAPAAGCRLSSSLRLSSASCGSWTASEAEVRSGPPQRQAGAPTQHDPKRRCYFITQNDRHPFSTVAGLPAEQGAQVMVEAADVPYSTSSGPGNRTLSPSRTVRLGRGGHTPDQFTACRLTSPIFRHEAENHRSVGDGDRSVRVRELPPR